MAGERHGRGMGPTWYVWISLKRAYIYRRTNQTSYDSSVASARFSASVLISAQATCGRWILCISSEARTVHHEYRFMCKSLVMDGSSLSRQLSNTLCMKNETASRGAVKILLLTNPCYPPAPCSQVISHLICIMCSLFRVRNYGSVPKIGCWLAFVAHRLWSGSVIFLYQWQPTWRVSTLAVGPNWVGLHRVSVFAAPSNFHGMSRRMQAFCAPKLSCCSSCGDNENPVSPTFVT
jgi:hypothetical protein